MAPLFPRSGPGESGSPMSQVLLGCYDFPLRIPGHLFASLPRSTRSSLLRVSQFALPVGRRDLPGQGLCSTIHPPFLDLAWRKGSFILNLPSHHSITSSARASNVGGTSRPSALAVLRLITSSYLVGSCTGRSAATGRVYHFLTGTGQIAVFDIDADVPTVKLIQTAGSGGASVKDLPGGRHGGATARSSRSASKSGRIALSGWAAGRHRRCCRKGCCATPGILRRAGLPDLD